MLIDWFTVVAQAINFLVLVYLMSRFLYKPILAAIDERELIITTKVNKAEQMEVAADKIKDELNKKINDFNNQKQKRYSDMNIEIDSARVKLLDETREEVEVSRIKWRNNLNAEVAQFQQNFILETHREALTLANKTLHDLADIQLESHFVKVFVKKLTNLAPEKREELKEEFKGNLKAPIKDALINSAYELTSLQIKAIRDALNESLETEVDFRVNVKPQITCGIELLLNGKKLVWSTEGYLETLASEMNKFLKDKGQVERIDYTRLQ